MKIYSTSIPVGRYETLGGVISGGTEEVYVSETVGLEVVVKVSVVSCGSFPHEHITNPRQMNMSKK